MIEQPWWQYDKTLQYMTGEACRYIGKQTLLMEKRTGPIPKKEQADNIAAMKIVLNYLMIKRIAKSTFINSISLLINLPPHETRKVLCPLIAKYKKIL